jgi:hypothetical protein
MRWTLTGPLKTGTHKPLKVSGKLTLFKETGKIRESFQTYCSVTSEALVSYREAVLEGDSARLQSKGELWSDQINNLYETVLKRKLPTSGRPRP